MGRATDVRIQRERPSGKILKWERGRVASTGSGLVQFETGRVWAGALRLSKADADSRGGLWNIK